MDVNRRTATTVGVLFIVATTASLAGNGALGSALEGPDVLSSISAAGNGVLVSALLTFVAACTSAGIAMALYPVLRKFHEGLAITAVGFRLFEGIFYTIGAACLVALFALSRQTAGAQDAGAQMLGKLLVTGKDMSGFVFGVMAFCIGGFAYYIVFYRFDIVPRWLSMFGMIALVLLFAAVLITLFDGEPYSVSGNLVALAAPIALQEMILAVWLIVKGFDQSALASKPRGS
jgi:hypothetical protein